MRTVFSMAAILICVGLCVSVGCRSHRSAASTPPAVPGVSTDATTPTIDMHTSIAMTRDFENCSILTISPDGNALSTLGQGLFPRFSPDGTRIVYCTRSWRGANEPAIGNIYVMHADGSAVKALTDFPAGTHGYYPCWTPDGKRIVFMRSDLANNVEDLCIIDADGSNLINLTNHRQSGRSSTGPFCAPDGRIVYAHRPGGSNWDYHVRMMNQDGSDDRFVVNTPGLDIDINISPVGQTIAFCSFVIGSPNTCQIYTVNTDGTNLQQLTTDAFLNMCPVFSPDGTRLAYAMCREYEATSNGNIRIINADGTGTAVDVPHTHNCWPNSWATTGH